MEPVLGPKNKAKQNKNKQKQTTTNKQNKAKTGVGKNGKRLWQPVCMTLRQAQDSSYELIRMQERVQMCCSSSSVCYTVQPMGETTVKTKCTWENQSLPQNSHLCVVSGLLELLRSFLQAFFFLLLCSPAFLSLT